ncbi:hypothetical protein HLK59_13125 [Streptomyces sp. S3(2020)]|uniref:hypothetical protein n=1 Tax=Streptomyces sp. S3(2020) TaxID=2732044 RepID=UPI001488FCCF|nr:hypothetical protein [Streptomyces sp. S3(2020)]NNN31291.1 hypothetical protein [Streptomyces sp. S3(2020)]
MQITLDGSGFIRRECPACQVEFKWFYGETAERPENFLEPESYFCPYCAEPAAKDAWWTPAQLSYMEEMAKEVVKDELEYEFSRSGLKFTRAASSEPSTPPYDPDDMVIVEPPCHPFEPLKVIEDRLGELHCLMCGMAFTV